MWRRFSLFSSNEVTLPAPARWPLAGTGRKNGTDRTGKWWKNGSRWYTLRLCFISLFSQSRSCLAENDGRFFAAGCISRFLLLLLLLYFSFRAVPTVLPALSFLRLSRFTSSYISGTLHKYISAWQTVCLTVSCDPTLHVHLSFIRERKFLCSSRRWNLFSYMLV